MPRRSRSANRAGPPSSETSAWAGLISEGGEGGRVRTIDSGDCRQTGSREPRACRTNTTTQQLLPDRGLIAITPFVFFDGRLVVPMLERSVKKNAKRLLNGIEVYAMDGTGEDTLPGQGPGTGHGRRAGDGAGRVEARGQENTTISRRGCASSWRRGMRTSSSSSSTCA